MSDAPPNSQGIRSININNPTSTLPTPAEIVYVDVYTDPVTEDKFILWEDIRLAFPNVLHVLHKDRIVPFMKDPDFYTLKPFRIALIPGEVLDIIVGNPQDTAPQHQLQQQLSMLRRIEQQAARLPRHNPLSTLRPVSSIHSSSMAQNDRCVPAGNDFARSSYNSRQQLDDTAVRGRNKELAHRYAREGMATLAPKINLDALHSKGDGVPGAFWKALECYLKAVHLSHAYAQIQVGDLFLEGGPGVTKDSSVAIRWYLKAAYQGEANAQQKLEAVRLSEPRKRAVPNAPINNTLENQECSSNTSKNSDRRMSIDSIAFATDIFEQLLLNASHGDKDAQIALGDMYKYGDGVSQDYQAAMNWYLKAAEQGDPIGQSKIGALFHHGQGVPQDYTLAMDWYLKAAIQGHASSQYNIGVFYCYGRGVPQDYTLAMEWYLKAANQGHAPAQSNVGVFYSRGQGVQKNYVKAMVWHLKAALQENVHAQFNIGMFYSRGYAVSQDFEQAMSWFLKAANQGDTRSQYNIGVLYCNGQGVPKDYEQAMVWYLKAAAQGDSNSQHSIGVLYNFGRGVPQDYVRAMGWYLKAAKQNHAKAQYNIGVLHSHGHGVLRSYIKAARWLQMAADQGYSDAKTALEALEESEQDH